ncbi:MAG: hypothetical protein NTY53_26040, partial [Kiritimatiellaeota bacterium]|nr:hypothetical protein [Kiritimatiellota bacterium]
LNNLRLIDWALQQYALVNSNALASSMDMLVGMDACIKDTPVCKGGGTYTLPSDLSQRTSCSVHGMLGGATAASKSPFVSPSQP